MASNSANIPTDAAASRKKSYQADGYVIARGVIDLSALDEINLEMGRMFALQLESRGLPIDPGSSRDAFQRNAARLLGADVQAYISTARLTQMIPAAHRLLISEPVIALGRELGIEFPVISTRVSNHIMSDALRIPGGYHKSPPHQDWRSMQGSLDAMVFWIPTTPVTAHPLEVSPGSHLHGLLPTVDHIMTPAVSDPRVTEESFIPLVMGPGDVVAFSSFLVHRTGERGDGHVRIAFSGRLNNAAERTYVDHAYPTPYKYSYTTDLLFDNFPTREALRTIFPDAT